ncbi:biotin--[acetyl-CoA-carboxylase] ligase [Mucisphaera sp.]|uniref:biotin--[acetyl-CoA-carboxylase] ligase n=1 Tax=Mucisphaera sp. TaxID=2913024 RepID=UPI003D1430B1
MWVSWHDCVGSTNDVAAALAAEGRVSPFVVAARRQTGGRGRTGRRWSSPEGGAWFTLAWRPPEDWRGWDLASLAVGVAVRRVLLELLGAETAVAIKWPNDLLINGRKVAGVLCERPWAGRDPEQGGDWLIAGVGVNVCVDPTSLGEGLRIPAVSLDTYVDRPDVCGVVERCAERMVDVLRLLGGSAGSECVLKDVVSSLAWRHQVVRVGEIEGRLEGLDSRGRLMIETRADGLQTVVAGDVERASLSLCS